MQRPAIFLDRDGTLIVDQHYLRDPSLVVPLPFVFEALRSLHTCGFALVVVTNQSGIARGIIHPSEHEAVRAAFERTFEREGIRFDGYYMCPHAPGEGCACRKPEPGMLHDATRDLDLDLGRSVMVGDRESDMGAGKNAGCRTAFLGGTKPSFDYEGLVATDWRDLVGHLLRL